MTNATLIENDTTPILALADADNRSRDNRNDYEARQLQPAAFARQHTDVAFAWPTNCLPNCSFYDDVFAFRAPMSFTQTFRAKYLIDVDGMSFSGRWRAFLQSRSVGIKATIFREWHDARLFAWRHFAPLDNRFGELWSLLVYFIGVDEHGEGGSGAEAGRLEVPPHDYEAAKLARQSREWAGRVLRREDMEVYLFRLLLEYGRLIDDDRDRIGTVGDGGKEMEKFDRKVPALD